jgi:pimeloyl-ACP methyl ester carboxylesterase
MAFPSIVPYIELGGEGRIAHFAHANGYPPRAYLQLLQGIATNSHVFAMHMRPLWPGAEPKSISDWRPLADDLAGFLDQKNLNHLVGWGHSMGATTTLRLALRQPERFKALVLIDPVFFAPLMIRLWNMIYRLGLANKVQPLAKAALKRRTEYDTLATMYTNYRKKEVFRRMSDQALMDYVEALACTRTDGTIGLCYPARWEARIYITAMRADLELWRNLARLKAPMLIIRGEKSDTFLESTGHRMQRNNPSIQVCTLPDASHLVAMEKPGEILAIAQAFLDDKN